MDDVWFYVMQFLELDEIVIMSHASNNMFTITRRFQKLDLKPCDLIYLSLSKNYLNVTKFLIEKKYIISPNSVNLVISIGNFELLNRMNYDDKLNNNMIISAISSGNIKMIKFIKNKLKELYVCTQHVSLAVMKTDNVEIYRLLIGGSLSHDKLVTLIDHNCFNIIEYYRFNNQRESFETVVLRHAIFSHNQTMINHCIENRYDNHQTKRSNLTDYLDIAIKK